MSHEARLKELGLELPTPPAAAGNYLPAVQAGKLVYLAGVLCMREGKLTHTGQVGSEQTVDSGAEAARVCALNALANLRAAAGSLDHVKQLVSVSGYVNAVNGFADSPAVLNGASDLFVQALGDAGRHARAAVAVCGLPRNATVEIQLVAELV